ncbi:MAG: chemotaxis protein CheX [Proteobacteria bacterium]|nr:chemotaxis protein CheX [Pseudomonadota bacterium]
MNSYILLVHSNSGTLSPLAGDLEALGFRIQQASGGENALDLVAHIPLLALVVLDGEIGGKELVYLVTAIKKVHPDLPILLLKPAQDVGTGRFGEFMPDVILDAGAGAGEIRDRAERLLCQKLYPGEVVETIQSRSRTVLWEAFKSDLKPGAPCLRANRNMLGPICAILSFCGPGIAGRLVVSGTHEHLAAIYRRIIPDVSDVSIDAAEDLAGEMANQIVGRIKEYFVSRGIGFELASPVFLSGADVEVRYKAGRPSLVIPFHESEDTLFVQFCVDRLDREALGEAEGENVASGGSIVFL